MTTSADNKMKALASRVQKVYELTGMLVGGDGNENMSADKIFVSFLLVGLAKEHGLLDDNCNRAVAKALNAVGMEEKAVPPYLEK